MQEQLRQRNHRLEPRLVHVPLDRQAPQREQRLGGRAAGAGQVAAGHLVAGGARRDLDLAVERIVAADGVRDHLRRPAQFDPDAAARLDQLGLHQLRRQLGEHAVVADKSKLWANVTVYHNVRIGKNCIVHSGTVLGSDGFGFANERGNWLKIPQVGTVLIGDDTEIGANTTIDRGALGDTVIGKNVILDNQVQIAHNVQIGDHTAIAGCTVVAGSTKIGKYCIIGGACAINGHMEICDGVQITGMSMIIKSITEKGIYSSGTPASTNLEWRKNSVRFRQLDQMYQKLRELEQQMAALSLPPSKDE